MQRTLKIIKISEGVFKHVLNDDINIDTVFFNTEETKLTIDLGTIVFEVGSKTRVFRVEEIEVYDIAATTAKDTPTLDELVKALADLKYPPLVEQQATNTSNTQWDTMTPSQTATTDVFTYKAGAEVQKTVTITYTDSTKKTISKIEKI